MKPIDFKLFTESVEEERKKSINEIADWDDPKLKKKDADTISCDDDERYERVPIKRAVKKMYPNLFTDNEIDAAIEACCKKFNQSRERQAFYSCVITVLFEKHT